MLLLFWVLWCCNLVIYYYYYTFFVMHLEVNGAYNMFMLYIIAPCYM